MSQSKPRYYLDENMDPEIAEQLRRRGIDAFTARDVSLLEVSDDVQLRYAASQGRMLCTKDSGFSNPANWIVTTMASPISPMPISASATPSMR